MAQITPNLGLTVWNNLADPYDSSQLAQNFVAIDQHDHSGSGKGAQINATSAIVDGTISSAKLASPSVNTANFYTNSVDSTILKSSSSVDADRAITTNHIKDGVITKAKLDSTNAGSYVLPKYVNALPSSPSNGDEIFYQDTTTNVSGSSKMSDLGVIWHLRYNSSSSSSYKWEFLGGGNISQFVTTSGTDTTNGTTYGGLTGVTTARITVPLSGEYTIYHHGRGTIAVNNGTVVGSVGVNTISPTNATADPYSYAGAVPNSGNLTSGSRRVTLPASSGNYIACVFRHGGNGTVTMYDHGLYVTPVRVG